MAFAGPASYRGGAPGAKRSQCVGRAAAVTPDTLSAQPVERSRLGRKHGRWLAVVDPRHSAAPGIGLRQTGRFVNRGRGPAQADRVGAIPWRQAPDEPDPQRSLGLSGSTGRTARRWARWAFSRSSVLLKALRRGHCSWPPASISIASTRLICLPILLPNWCQTRPRNGFSPARFCRRRRSPPAIAGWRRRQRARTAQFWGARRSGCSTAMPAPGSPSCHGMLATTCPGCRWAMRGQWTLYVLGKGRKDTCRSTTAGRASTVADVSCHTGLCQRSPCRMKCGHPWYQGRLGTGLRTI